MNIKPAIISIVVIASSSSSSLVQGKLRTSSSLRASTTQSNQEMDKVNENDKDSTTRKLDSYHGHCSFEGKVVKPGQWLQGPEKTCMCDRHGSQAFVACVANGAMAAAAPPPGAALTALGARQEFKQKDFVFDLLGSVPVITPGGSIQALTVDDLPSMAGLGVSYTLVNLEPCAINLPHVHPRAAELIFVIHGKGLRTAFVEENGGRPPIVNDIGIGETTFFPQGLIHYQQNLSCEPVQFLAALSSEDPGVVTITTQFFELPGEAVTTSLNQGADLVHQLIAGLPSNPAEGRKECLDKCGYGYSW